MESCMILKNITETLLTEKNTQSEPSPNEKLVTIVIPCYKQSNLLSQSVQSCIDQTYPYIEIIVIDDGSPDNVNEVLEPFEKKIIFVKQQNMGLSAARNTGLKFATGKYIKFLDADDWLLPNCIEEQYNVLKEMSQHIAVGGYRLYFDGQNREDEDIYPEFGRLRHALCYVNTGPPHTFLFPTEAVREAGGFATETYVKGGHEDYDLLCRLACMGFEAVVLHSIVCVYRQTPKSMSQIPDNMRRTRRAVWIRYVKKILTMPPQADTLLHLIGGYCMRLKSVDLRYEIEEILHEILKKLIVIEANLSLATRVLLCNQLSRLLLYHPLPLSSFEYQQRNESRQLIGELVEAILNKITIERVIGINTVNALLNLAGAFFQVGLKIYGRIVVRKVILIAPRKNKIFSELNLLDFLSVTLPGKPAICIWRCIRCIFEVFRTPGGSK